MTSYGNETLLVVSMIVIMAVLCVFVLLYYIGLWMTLQKMGRHDFAALIPGYDLFEQARGAGASTAFSAAFVCIYAASTFAASYMQITFQNAFWKVASSNFSLFAGSGGAVSGRTAENFYDKVWAQMGSGVDIVLIVVGILAVIQLVMQIYVYYGISKSFGHGVGYTIGLVLFAPIFFAILGCSRKQAYIGPMLDKSYREYPRDDWNATVKARIATFGSNAPLALAVLGLASGACFLGVPGIVLSIGALVKNRGETAKPLARSKGRAANAIAVIGIIVSIATFVLLAMGVDAFISMVHRYYY